MKYVFLLAMSAAFVVCAMLPSFVFASPSHMSRPAPNLMEMIIQTTVRTGEEFTIGLADKRDETPVGDAEVLLTTRHQAGFYFSGQNDGSSKQEAAKFRAKVLGTTDEKGELHTTLDEPGEFFIIAQKTGFAAALRPITVGNAQEGATFKVSKQVFGPTQKVTFTLANNTESIVTLSCGAPWQIFKHDGSPVFSPISITVMIYLEPGKEITWTWDQKDNEGNQVQPGAYVVVLKTSKGSMSASFTITGLRADKDFRRPDPKMPEERPFKDVTGEHGWGDPHVLMLHRRNIVKGKTTDLFDPDGFLTRAEFVAMLIRACGT